MHALRMDMEKFDALAYMSSRTFGIFRHACRSLGSEPSAAAPFAKAHPKDWIDWHGRP